MEQKRITFKLLLLMAIFFIFPAYIFYEIFGKYDYISNQEADIMAGIIFPIILLTIGAIVFKCNVTNYCDQDLNKDIKYVDDSGKSIDHSEIPKCILRFFTLFDEFSNKNPKLTIFFISLVIITLVVFILSSLLFK